MKMLPLHSKHATGDRKFALVDDKDFDKASQHKWWLIRVQERKTWRVNYYVQGKVDGKLVYLHRFILTPPRHLRVDHKNHNTLDNRRENLRLATSKQNAQNRRKRRTSKSGYLGVSWIGRDKRWVSTIVVDETNHQLGYNKTEIVPAILRDINAVRHHKEFALLNFPAYRNRYIEVIEEAVNLGIFIVKQKNLAELGIHDLEDYVSSPLVNPTLKLAA